MKKSISHSVLAAILLLLNCISESRAFGDDPVVPADPPQARLNLSQFKFIRSGAVIYNGQLYSSLSFKLINQNDLPAFDYRTSLTIANAMTTGMAAYGVLKWDTRQDKVRHFFAGYVIGNITNGTFQMLLPDRYKNRRLVSALAGFGTGTAIGIAKEVYDSYSHGVPSFKDALATAIGAGVGTLTITYDLNKLFRKKNSESDSKKIEE